MNLSDNKLELQFLASLIDLTAYDLPEARKFVDNKGVVETDFGRAEHWHLYRAVAQCVLAGVPSSPDNLLRELRTIVPEASYEALALAVSGTADAGGPFLDGYWDKVQELADRRLTARQLEVSLDSIRRGHEPAASVKFRLGNILSTTRGRLHSRGLDEYVDGVEKHLKNVMDGLVPPVTPWYIRKLDAAIGGLQPTLILIGAEPGIGKSALVAAGVNLQALNGHKPFVASLEDDPSWLAYRVVSHDSKKNQYDLRFAKLNSFSFGQIHDSNEKLRDVRKNIRIIDGSISGMRIEDLISSITDAIVNEGCDSVWIDHLGEIALSNSERTDLEISRHLSLLRGVANRHGVPVIVCSHFKRLDDPQRPPNFRDFANSSGSERKARVALGLRRQPGSDLLMCHIMKQTNGPAGGVVDLEFSGTAAMVMDTEGGIQ